ncbi:ARF/SAR superfamily [Linderina pennispora]|uniref:ADP-ribosylation factor n=1 Tax=Linderina pennispora TaxID=61395 RepID=A0A1Y1WIB5_9FUNG|nr:ARF/SAR superfamily [Linderina pennispora]ORX73105.1 ARF/SAR superfamily [Linderina pennispora]
MGKTLSTLMPEPAGNTKVRVLMLGLDAPGKTSILYRLLTGRFCTTCATIGYNTETVPYNNMQFELCDVGGAHGARRLWYHYFGDMLGVIFVIDSNDRERMSEARDELRRLMNEDVFYERDIPVLVLANKQDLPNAMTQDEVAEKLGLYSERHIRWTVMPSCAKTGEGLFEGLNWLCESIKVRRRS